VPSCRGRRDHLDGRVAGPSLGEPRPLGGGEHVLRVLQFARSGDDHVGGQRYPIVEVAIVEVEFLGEIGERIPAAQIVIDRHAGIPLRDVVHLAVARLAPGHAAAPFAGNGEMVADAQRELAVREQCHRQRHLHARVRDHRRDGNRLAAGQQLDRLDRHAVGGAAGHAPACHGTARPRPIEILIELEPEIVEPVWAVVGVGDRRRPADALGGRIECRVDLVVRPVLPIARAGHAVCAPDRIGGAGQRERREGGGGIVARLCGRGQGSEGERPGERIGQMFQGTAPFVSRGKHRKMCRIVHRFGAAGQGAIGLLRGACV
jgi:hypothetical protein